jgi:large subunit ribosomal protein L25
MVSNKLTLQRRDSGTTTRKAIARGQLIGVLYGHGIDSQPVTGELKTVRKVLEDAGTSQLIDVTLEKETHQALLKDLDINPVTNEIRHFDLYAIKKGEKITTDIPIELVGDAPAGKTGLIINQLLSNLEITTLPAHLPEEFSIDISKLAEVGDSIHVSDLELGEKVEVAEELLKQPIVQVEAPREEEPEPETEDVVDAADVPSEHGSEDDTEGGEETAGKTNEEKQE